MNSNNTLRNTIIFTASSILMGLLYFVYISAIPFPHSIVRIVPFIWLIMATLGFRMSLSVFSDQVWYLQCTFYIVAVANIFFACIFSLGALMGD